MPKALNVGNPGLSGAIRGKREADILSPLLAVDLLLQIDSEQRGEV